MSVKQAVADTLIRQCSEALGLPLNDPAMTELATRIYCLARTADRFNGPGSPMCDAMDAKSDAPNAAPITVMTARSDYVTRVRAVELAMDATRSTAHRGLIDLATDIETFLLTRKNDRPGK